MQKMLMIAVALLLLLLAAYFYSSNQSSVTKDVASHGLPWQVEKTHDSIRVFSIEIAHSSLRDVVNALGDDYQLAVMKRPKEAGVLEMYYTSFKTGPLAGKLILVAKLERAVVDDLIARSAKTSVLETGARKSTLTTVQAKDVMSATVIAITFAPIARLDHDLVLSRFGKPQRVEKIDEFISHYHYPESGMTVIINLEGKDFVEYSQPVVY